MNSPIIALVDCHSFYCSCERVFRPDLKNKPVVVLSNNDGCAVSRTEEAKKLGVKMGEPLFKFKHLCNTHDLVAFSANFSLYTNFSDRVMSNLKKFSPNVEVYSVDEAFMDISGFGDPIVYAEKIKQRIEINTAIPVGIGIGPTKVLAKAANKLVKTLRPSTGVISLLDQEMRLEFLAKLEICDVWGIGRANTPKMKSLGIHTAKDLMLFDNDQLILKMFSITGFQIKQELAGISCFPLNGITPAKKEILCSRSFAHSLSSKDLIKEAISEYVTDATEKLRAQDSVCQEITVFARTNPFQNVEQFQIYETIKLDTPTLDTLKLIKVAFEALERGFQEGHQYKKAGVKLSSFYQSAELQLDLLSELDSPQKVQLMNVIDAINAKEGHTIIKSGSCGTKEVAWNMNQSHKSPRFTTSWSELPKFN